MTDRRIEVSDSMAEPGKVEFTIPLNDFQSTGFSVVEDTARALLDALVNYFEYTTFEQALEDAHEEGYVEGHDSGYAEGYEDAEYELGDMNA